MPHLKRKSIDATIRAILKSQNTLENLGTKEFLREVDNLRRTVVLAVAEQGELSPTTAQILKERVDAITRNFVPKLSETLTTNQRRLFIKGLQLMDEVAQGAGLTTAVPFLSEQTLTRAQQFGADLVTNLTDFTRGRIAQDIDLAVLGQKPMGEVLKDIGSSLKIGGGKQPQSVFGTVAKRAETIFRTEVNRMANLAAVDRMKQVSATGAVPDLQKQWLHSHVGAPRSGHLALDNVVIGVDEKFNLVGDDGVVYRVDAPQSPVLPVGEVVNCKCSAIPVVGRFT